MVDELWVGETRLRDEPAILVDRRVDALGDGLLPLHLFSRVTFNGPARYMVAGRLSSVRR
jgi:hypothetical protein